VQTDGCHLTTLLVVTAEATVDYLQTMLRVAEGTLTMLEALQSDQAWSGPDGAFGWTVKSGGLSIAALLIKTTNADLQRKSFWLLARHVYACGAGNNSTTGAQV
jgi:hypothetical protein